jgi:phage terminase small subunit
VFLVQQKIGDDRVSAVAALRGGRERFRKAPDGLSKARVDLWDAIVRDFDLGDDTLEVLTMFCQCLDRYDEARAEIEKHGAYYKDRFGSPKPHPAVAVERDCLVSAARLWRELDLDHGPAPSPLALKGRR